MTPALVRNLKRRVLARLKARAKRAPSPLGPVGDSLAVRTATAWSYFPRTGPGSRTGALGGPPEGQTIGSSALLPEDEVREFLPEPIRLVRIGRVLEPTRES